MALHLTSCERQLDADRVVATGFASWFEKDKYHPGLATKYLDPIVRKMLTAALKEYAA